MSAIGLEPIRFLHQRILSPLCLPFHHTDWWTSNHPLLCFVTRPLQNPACCIRHSSKLLANRVKGNPSLHQRALPNVSVRYSGQSIFLYTNLSNGVVQHLYRWEGMYQQLYYFSHAGFWSLSMLRTYTNMTTAYKI